MTQRRDICQIDLCVFSLQTSAEMFSEVVLSNALNKLRGGPFGDSDNMCTTFVETKAYDI
jgi:hypothetical protein